VVVVEVGQYEVVDVGRREAVLDQPLSDRLCPAVPDRPAGDLAPLRTRVDDDHRVVGVRGFLGQRERP